ncbi:MAG: TIGR03546 family protein [Planctomycetota bacterium]|nr:MAG: TIGR03546 family protein [Planctomycetota bacterium]
MRFGLRRVRMPVPAGRQGGYMFLILRPLRLLFKALVIESTPTQMSYGLALGVLLGVVPKGNLLAVVLGFWIAATRVNLAITACAAVAATFASSWFDTPFDQIGGYVLNQPALREFWDAVYDTPMMPWTDFNNSIVMGSFICGVLLIWPVHRVSRPVFQKYSEKIARHIRHWWITKLLLGAEWADRFGTIEV